MDSIYSSCCKKKVAIKRFPSQYKPISPKKMATIHFAGLLFISLGHYSFRRGCSFSALFLTIFFSYSNWAVPSFTLQSSNDLPLATSSQTAAWWSLISRILWGFWLSFWPFEVSALVHLNQIQLWTGPRTSYNVDYYSFYFLLLSRQHQMSNSSTFFLVG